MDFAASFDFGCSPALGAHIPVGAVATAAMLGAEQGPGGWMAIGCRGSRVALPREKHIPPFPPWIRSACGQLGGQALDPF